MKTSHVSYGFLLSFLGTVGAAHWAPFPAALGSVFISVSLSLLFTKKVTLATVIACVVGIAVGISAVRISTHVTTKNNIETYADGGTKIIHGTVSDAPDVRPTVTKLTIAVDHMTDGSGKTISVTGKVLVNDYGGWPAHRYGERITVKGKLKRPEPIERFAYDDYLSVRGIYAVITRGSVSTAEDESMRTATIGDRLFGSLIAIRTRFEGEINQILPEPHASLLAGLLTGSRRGIPKHLTDDFRLAGITHIIAISGYNVTIILTLLSGLLFWIPLKKRFPILVIGIIAFCLFVGSSPSVIRATVMGILGLLALQSGRQTTVRLTILWAAFFMLCWNPKYLWFDASFQLSFLAVIGLSELSEPLKKLLKRVPETLALKVSLIATIAAQIATLPLTMIIFRQISLVAPITNVLVAPLIPIAMLVGFIATMASFVSTPLGLLIGYVTWAFLQTIIRIAEIFAHLPLAVITW